MISYVQNIVAVRSILGAVTTDNVIITDNVIAAIM